MRLRAFAAGTAAAVVAVLVLVAVIESWSPGAWGALAAWLTFGVAAAAGYIALRQWREQAQPYVAAYMEPSAAASILIELVVKNFGATAAHDVCLTITPKPTRAIDKNSPPEERDLWLPERIPVLVPGQEWRTLWDSGLNRYKGGRSLLPERHEATVSYIDSHGGKHQTTAVLDWRMLSQRDTVEVYGAHHAAKALRAIDKTIAGWNESAAGGLAVYARDGDAKDERDRKQWEARRAAREARESPPDPAS